MAPPVAAPPTTTTAEALVAPLRRYREAMSEALRAAGHEPVPPAAKWLLLELRRDAGTVNDLAVRLHLPKQAISRLADRLGDSGYCTRERDGNDRRQVWLSLTDEGVTAAATLHAAIEELDRRLLSRVEVADRRAFERVLCVLAADDGET